MEVSIISLETRKGMKRGEVKTVRRGYARYLMTQNKALSYDPKHPERLQQIQSSLAKEEVEHLKRAEQQAEKIKDLSLKVSSRAAEHNRLYGSIGPKEIIESLMQAGITVEKQVIHLPKGVIRHLGTHEVILNLHPTINIPLTIEVVPS